MLSSPPKLSFFLLMISFGLMAVGLWYMTGISTRWFMVTTRNHLMAFSKGVLGFFQGMI